MGRRRLEDARRGRASRRQCERTPLRRDPRSRPARHRLQQYRADHRPSARREFARDQASEARLAGSRRRRLPHGALRGRGLEGDPQAGRGDRLRRHRIEFRLPARDVRARHGLGRRPGARIHRDGGALVQAEHAHAGHREAHAEHHGHPLPGARGKTRRRGRRVAHQHHHLDHAGRSRLA